MSIAAAADVGAAASDRRTPLLPANYGCVTECKSFPIILSHITKVADTDLIHSNSEHALIRNDCFVIR